MHRATHHREPHRRRIHFLMGTACSVVVLIRPLSAADWPCFRGPTRQGIAADADPPVEWSASVNVLWNTAIPGEGWSSPIVSRGKVYVTAATERGASCRVLALDQASGAIAWDVEAGRQTPGRKEGKNSHATPTPATDGERVYAVFGDGSIVCLGLDGALLWTNREVQHHSKHGLGASPLLHGDLLIMAFDGSSPEGDLTLGWKQPWDRAVILALDKLTGKRRWQGSRGLSRIAHVTPNTAAFAGRDQLVAGAGDVVQGFDLTTGERLWSAFSQGEGVVPSIVVGDGLIFSASGFEAPTIRAVRLGGKGDVTGSHIVWEQKKGVPNQPSLLYSKPNLYAITDGGVATCFRAETGEIVWQERIGGNHSASPVLAAGRIYFLSEDGESAVIAAGEAFRLLAKNAIGERCQASMAVAGGQIFIRSAAHLYAIGKRT